MNEPQLILSSPPIIEAVVDIDCDMPPDSDIEALDAAAGAALADQYPTSRRRMLSEHQISAAPDGPLNELRVKAYRPSSISLLTRSSWFSFDLLASRSTASRRTRPSTTTFWRSSARGGYSSTSPSRW